MDPAEFDKPGDGENFLPAQFEQQNLQAPVI
jgi:hypothetical protein